MTISLGATKLPMRHISIRVPWHDAGWDGTVCRHPIGNRSCMVLGNIQDNKDDDAEARAAGKLWTDLERPQLPPCITERAGFMAPFPYTRFANHAYARMGKSSHAHFTETAYRHAPYSAAAIPFRWMLREQSVLKAEQHHITGYDHEREARADELIGFKAAWVQVKENQISLLDTFFSAVEPETSLCFFYAKQTPLSEDPRRVIVGVGRVAELGQPVEYAYSRPGELTSMLWERDVIHSIRPDMRDGFLLPYHQLLEAAIEDPTIELPKYVAHAPDDAFDNFSYVSEHVDHDQAIAALLNCAESLREAAKILPGDWDTPLAWIDARLNELWQLRGPHPGLGSALTAYGIEHGTFLAYELAREATSNEDLWPSVELLFANPAMLGHEWQRRLGTTLPAMWRTLPDERKALLKLLSRFNISAEQATRFFRENVRRDVGIAVSDAELLANPYLFYELDRVSANPILFGTVDRGIFPDPVVREVHPLPEPTAVNDASDVRRARALMVHVLEAAAAEGHTVRSRDQVIKAISDLQLKPECPMSYDLLPLVEERFDDVVTRVAMADEEPAYQLGWLTEMGHRIAGLVNARASGKRHVVNADWRRLLDDELKEPVKPGDLAEERARQEKAAALAELAEARFSVLVGPAGTGKTTMLKVLCSHPTIRDGGILLLAPTGKARVQIERRTGRKAQTIAQFLVRRKQYDPNTGRHTLSTRAPENAYRTVIIDESSMLTEDQLAATLSAFERAPVDRIILVGDPRQLPPIGAGRPFVDIITRLRQGDSSDAFPRVSSGYGELTIIRRMREDDDAATPYSGAGVSKLTTISRSRAEDGDRQRDDVLLAQWFSGQALDPGADEIWNRVASEEGSDNLRFVKWKDASTLHDTLIDTLVEELELSGRDDIRGFELKLGGNASGDYMYYNLGAAKNVDAWQILTPVNLRAHGVDEINRAIQRHFRGKTLDYARSRNRRIPEPAGPDTVVYGDKVINIENKRRDSVWPKENAFGYVANGEIGLVIGRTGWKNRSKPDNLWVEFSSQPGHGYDFYKSEFGDEGSHPLRLAYALTIHKAQGSEFGKTFLVLPDPLPMMSRELLYTALTRQQHKVIILHQGDLIELKRFDGIEFSETARRQTNLFAPPKIVRIGDAFLEDALIHRTISGIAVRSKSEVIIANGLDSHGLSYAYEQPLRYGDGGVWYPDFTIEDFDRGTTVYWEHLGLLHDPAYQARWERKLDWYRAHGILPREEGEGPQGMLVTTRDDERGGIDSAAIDTLIREVFGR